MALKLFIFSAINNSIHKHHKFNGNRIEGESFVYGMQNSHINIVMIFCQTQINFNHCTFSERRKKMSIYNQQNRKKSGFYEEYSINDSIK